MKSFLLRVTTYLFLVTSTMSIFYILFDYSIFFTLSITFGTTFYHFMMRLVVGKLVQLKYNNCMSWKVRWFQVGPREQKLYKILKVKAWKRYMPTFDVYYFDPKQRTYKQIVMAMCQAEVVHEIIMILSFLPIIASLYVGSAGVFISTSIVGAYIDLLFVMIQRYNRPRVKRLMTREHK